MGRRSALPCRRFLSIVLIIATAFCLPLLTFAQTTDSQQKIDALKGVEKDNPFERLKKQEEQNGKITPAYRDRVLQEAQKHNQRLGRDSSGVELGTPGQGTSGPAWVNIGPFGQDVGQNGSFTGEFVDSGRLRTILTHPTDGNIVYILSSAGGLWKTTNFQATSPNWTALTDFLPTTAGGAAAFGKTPSVIYLGLGDPYDQITVGGSIVKSTDGGTTWSSMIPLGLTISVRDVKVDTSGTNDIVLVATDGGLWRSTDSGANYSQVTGFAFQDQFIWSLVQTSAGWVMATQETQAITNGSCIAGARWCTGAGHIYLSTDKGASWTEQTNGLSNFGRVTLAAGGTNNAVVYAFAALPANGTSAAINQRDLFRSGDGGKTWVALGVNSTKAPTNPQTSYAANMNVMNGQAWYNQTIGVDPSDTTGNTVYLGGTYFSAKTTDGGATWTVLSEWLPGWAVYTGKPALPYIHADMHAMAFKTAGTPMVLMGTDGGIFASSDGGTTWDSTRNTNLATHMFYTITGSPFFPNFAMGGLQDNGTRVRVGNTGIFNQSLGGDGFGVGMSQANTETSMQTVYYNKVQRWRTNQEPKNYTESELSQSGQSSSISPFYTSLISPGPLADPTGKVFFTQGLTRIYKTTDGGLTPWTIFSTIGSTTGLSGVSFRDSPFGLGVSPTNINHLATGTNGGRCYVSLDGGTSWTYTLATDSVQGWPGFVSAVTWADDNTIWVSSNAQSEGLYTGVPAVRVVKSSDQGATWTAAGNGLPDVPVTKVLPNPTNPLIAYAATHVGVYRTIDGGANWAPYGSGLPNVRVNDIYMPPDAGYIRIGTYGRGMWQLSNLDYLGATMTDDGATCNNDGNVGNNETGHLTLSFKNATTASVAGGTVTIASDNPHLAFTAGTSGSLGTVAANAVATATFQVKVTGAVGIETANLTITYGDTAPVTITRPISFNYDDKASASGGTVSFESNNHGWTVSSATPLKLGDKFTWERRELSPVLHSWAVTDNNGNQDVSLVSPQLKTGANPVTFTFQHRYNFENGWDGGILEISTDGTTWTQIPAVNITVNPYSATLATSAGGNDDVLAGLPAFTGANAGWPAAITSTVDLGTTFANQNNLHIRFRAGADSSGGRQGWEIYGMSFTGLTNTPFGSYVAHNEACPSTASLVSGPVNPTNYPDPVTLTATVLGGVTPVTGDVAFKEGTTVLGTSTTASGIATFNTTTLPVGTHNLVASYLGDAGHAPVVSPVYKHTVLAVSRTSLLPLTLDFGDVRTGVTSPVMTSVLKNTGTAPLIITGMAVTGPYTQTNNCSTSLAAGASCTISVTFKPVGVQDIRTGTITLSANGISGDTIVTLTGNATRPFASLSKTAVSYANTLVGATTAAQTVTLTNSGNLPLTIATVAISAGDFAKTDNCTAAPIAPAGTCTITATFAPTATGNRTATVTFTDDADDTPQTIALSGKGETLQISGTTTQTVSKQSTATYPLTLTGSPSVTGTINLTCTGNPALTTCAVNPASTTLSVLGTSAVAVTVTPAPTTTTASAARTGQLMFAMFGLFGLMLVPLARKESGRKVISMVLLALVLTVSVGGMVACGDSKTPVHVPVTTTTYATPGTYTITITATSGGVTLQTQALTLTLQ